MLSNPQGIPAAQTLGKNNDRCLLWCILIVIIHLLSVCRWLFVGCLGYPYGHLLGKSCPLGFPLLLFLYLMLSLCSFPIWCLGWDVEFDQFLIIASSSTLSFPDHCLFIYFISSWSLPLHLLCQFLIIAFSSSLSVPDHCLFIFFDTRAGPYIP